jgi:hypothetical protein
MPTNGDTVQAVPRPRSARITARRVSGQHGKGSRLVLSRGDSARDRLPDRAQPGTEVTKEMLGEGFRGLLVVDRWAAYRWVARGIGNCVGRARDGTLTRRTLQHRMKPLERCI